MATINSKQIIDELIRNNGFLDAHPEEAPDNPAAISIVRYVNHWGSETYGVTFRGEDPARYLHETPFVRDPQLIWERKS